MNERSIFAAALDLADAGERAAYLDRVCGNDAGLRWHIEELLAAQEKLGSFLACPSLLPQATGMYAPVVEAPGTVIGPYKLMEQIGEGGMGLVFVAEQQQPVRRKVALKVIRPGMDTRDVVARFEAERQALALMDHPNIAKVLDGGETASGRPYFVMELVKGVPITEYCDANQLPPRERLRLFVSVCQAVQHAHQKGVIHRDLKPSNILVAPHDGVPVVKVIDFGVAKALGQQLTDKTIYTRFAQMIGTPLYMSPEQAELNALDVDTRSDVYALGVLLYELLTGTTPFELERFRKAAFDEIRRIIREEEPPRPSTRLRKDEGRRMKDEKQKLRGISLSFIPHPSSFQELDWIVMRCLEKDRSRRYETANGLARDVERYLRDEPVEACPPSLGYRLRKLTRRYKTPLALASGFVGLLLVGMVATFWQAVRAMHAEADASRQRDVAVANAEQSQASEQAAQEERERAEKAREDLRRTLYASQINLAWAALDADNGRRAQELLQEQVPARGQSDLRGFEWNYLHRLAHPELRIVQVTDQFNPTTTLSADGTRVAQVVTVRGTEREVKVWETASGKELVALPLPIADQEPDHTPPFSYRLLLNRHGTKLAVVRPDDLFAFDLRTQKQVFAITERGKFLSHDGYAFSPDGKYLAAYLRTGPRVSVVKVWETVGWQLLYTFPATLDGDGDCAFSPDGKRLAYSPGPRELRVVDMETGVGVFALTDHELPAQPVGITFTPDSSRVAAILDHRGFRPAYRMWDATTGKWLPNAELSWLPGGSRQLFYSRDGTRVVFGARGASAGPSVTIRNVNTGAVLATLCSHTRAVQAVAFSGDGRRLITAGIDGTVSTWDAKAGTDYDPHFWAKVVVNEQVTRIAVIEGSRAGRRKEIVVFDQAEKELVRFSGHTGRVGEIALSPDGTWVASVASLPGDSRTGAAELKVWDSASGKVHFTQKVTGYPFPEGRSDSWNTPNPSFSPDGRRVWMAVPAGESKEPRVTIKAWDMAGVEQATTDSLPDIPAHLWFTRDGSQLITDHGKKGLYLFDSTTGKQQRHDTLSDGGPVTMTPDGRTFAAIYAPLVTSPDPEAKGVKSLRLWNGTTGAVLWSTPLDVEYGLLRFSSEGHRLAVVCQPGWVRPTGEAVVKVFDVGSSREVAVLRGFNGFVASIEFSPDGRRIATVCRARLPSSDGRDEVKIWDAETGAELVDLKPAGQGSQITWSRDGHRLATLGAGWHSQHEVVKVWDVTPRPVQIPGEARSVEP